MKSTPLKIIGWSTFFAIVIISILFATGKLFNGYPTSPETVGENISPRRGLYNPANLIYITKDKIDRPYKYQVRFYTTITKFMMFDGFDSKEYHTKYPDDVVLIQYYDKNEDDGTILYVIDIFTDNPTSDIPGY